MQIEAGIHQDTGEVYARFQSLNPTNGLPPPVDIGLLPPENGTGRGQGHLSYVIRANTNLVTTGTEIRNIAYITFDGIETIGTDWVDPHDFGAGIDTNKQALVTMDGDLPTSSVAALPGTATNATFVVCWSGTDLGAGVSGYDVYVRTNGGSWALWLANTPEACGTFYGQNGQAYCFYTHAKDGAGLVQTNAPVVVCTQTLTNYPPVINPLPAQFIGVGQQFTITNVAWDPDQPLKFSLDTSAPPGATITASNGVFRWQPSCWQGTSTNWVRVWVTDSGTPPMSNSMLFQVVVSECVQPKLGGLVLQAGQTGRLPFNLTAPTPLTNLVMTLRLPSGRLTTPSLEVTNVTMICTNWITNPVTNTYQINLASCPGRLIHVTNRMEQEGWLYVTAVSNQSSAFLWLEFDDIVGRMLGGTLVEQGSNPAGRVVVVGEQPLLEAAWSTNRQPLLILYAKPGFGYNLGWTTNITSPPPWPTRLSVTMSNLVQEITVPPGLPQQFYRAWKP